jgi:Ca-activated chloride channel family protein
VSELFQLDMVPAREAVPKSSEPQVVYLQLLAQSWSSLPPQGGLQLCAMLDHSASMYSERVYLAHSILDQLLRELHDTDRLSLITLNNQIKLGVPIQPVTESAPFHAAINQLQPKGSTALAQGLALALQQFGSLEPGSVQQVLLLTDAHANSDEQRFAELLRQAYERGIGITTFNIRAAPALLFPETIPGTPNNRTYTVAADADIPFVLKTELSHLRSTIARNVQLVLSIHPPAKLQTIYQLTPYVTPLRAYKFDNNNWQVQMPDWVHPATSLLVKLLVPPLDVGETVMLQADLSYRSIYSPSVYSAAGTTLILPVVEHVEMTLTSAIQQALERIIAYQMQSIAEHAIAKGQLEAASSYLRTAGEHLLQAGENQLARTIFNEVARLLQAAEQAKLNCWR